MDVSAIYTIADARRLLDEGPKPNLATAAGRAEAASEKQKQIAAAAKQFEAIIVRQMLEPAIDPLMSSDPLGSAGNGDSGSSGMGGGGSIYSYLVTDSLANCLTQGGGLGLSNILEKQLTPRGSVPTAQAAAVYGAGEAKKS